MNSSQKLLRAGALLWLILAGPAAAQQPGGGEAPPPAVTVVTLSAEDVVLTASLPGRVLASAEAELRPQVNGIITERLFEEGSVVSAGDPLYRIDPRSYEAAVAQAEAALAQATAQADAATREAERVAALRDRSVASQQTEDSAIAARDAAQAAVKAAEAQLEAARIDLDRTTITAPLDGVIGLAQTSQGALVTASQATPLAVIRRIDPVQVDVTQSAADIIRWQRQGDGAALANGAARTVSLRLADGTVYEQTGSLTGAEPHVDETTGVVTLRMEFSNPDNLLLPGMYVLADIPQAELSGMILAPQEGVSRDRRGRPIAYVVNAENVVEQRMLEIVQDRGSDWVVREGLSDGDRIVVAGTQRIAPGVTVTPEERQEDGEDTDGQGAAGAEAGAAPQPEATEPAQDGTDADQAAQPESAAEEAAPDSAPQDTSSAPDAAAGDAAASPETDAAQAGN
ncbi:membrane fusion protein, multidrug efflux system [Paracoccus isoporae]|uniref:Membrane fusion protein, multidrug efflux system n=1 Tax=Paracoccus isoporae TaxID=591205 RepID=A0A1G7DEL3_9RHOB|nr:efflux RND transporter periplasmic adaptor subunit [Paracoccus isoporae]SDE49961.1 membrane fusion protein, multidrug efflux system [Paracoccus isoporae]